MAVCIPLSDTFKQRRSIIENGRLRWMACAATILPENAAQNGMEKKEEEEEEEEEEEMEWYGNDQPEEKDQEDDQFVAAIEQARARWQQHAGAHKS